jgi:membrane protein
MADPDPVKPGPPLERPRPAQPATGRQPVAGARRRFRGSLAEGVLSQLKELNFGDQALLFGAGALVSLLPLLILLSAFASERVDDDIALHLGLDNRAANIASHLFTSSPATFNAATATSLVFVVAGTIAIASSLQQIYEKIFRQDHRRGLPFVWRKLTWVIVMCAVVALESAVNSAVRRGPAGDWLVDVFTFVFYAPFFWWTMHFLLGGRVGWRRLLPSAIATGLCFVGLAVFSRFYFSPTIVSDNTVYGPLGTVFGLMTWLAAIGGLIIVGTVAGAVWEGRHRRAAA